MFINKELEMNIKVLDAKLKALKEWEEALKNGEEFEPWFDVEQELFYIEEEIRNPHLNDGWDYSDCPGVAKFS